MGIADEIKQRVTIGDLMQRLCLEPERNGNLQKPGGGQKSGSVHIYYETNSFHDYSEDCGGSVIDLYAYYMGVDDATAIRELAKLYGLTEGSPEPFIAPKQSEPAKFRGTPKFIDALTEDEKVLYDLDFGSETQLDEALLRKAESAAKRRRLESNSEVFAEMERYCNEKGWGDLAWRYILNKRQIPVNVVRAFRLFFIYNYHELEGHLKKIFKENGGLERLQKSGLFNDNGHLIFYSHRIIIPYIWKGNIVYMRGRYFDEQGNLNGDNKYLGLRTDATKVNTPKRFFNLDELDGMKDGEHLYITEGEFDAMAIKAMGFHAVAVPGAGNIPPEQKLKPLLRFSVIVCGDRDEAGEGFTDKLIQAFQYWRKGIKIKELPVGKDPNDFLTA